MATISSSLMNFGTLLRRFLPVERLGRSGTAHESSMVASINHLQTLSVHHQRGLNSAQPLVSTPSGNIRFINLSPFIRIPLPLLVLPSLLRHHPRRNPGGEGLSLSHVSHIDGHSSGGSVYSSTDTLVQGSGLTLNLQSIYIESNRPFSQLRPYPPDLEGQGGADSPSHHRRHLRARGRRLFWGLLAILSVASVIGIVFWLSYDARFRAPQPSGTATPEVVDDTSRGFLQLPVNLPGPVEDLQPPSSRGVATIPTMHGAKELYSLVPTRICPIIPPKVVNINTFIGKSNMETHIILAIPMTRMVSQKIYSPRLTVSRLHDAFTDVPKTGIMDDADQATFEPSPSIVRNLLSTTTAEAEPTTTLSLQRLSSRKPSASGLRDAFIAVHDIALVANPDHSSSYAMLKQFSNLNANVGLSNTLAAKLSASDLGDDDFLEGMSFVQNVPPSIHAQY